MIRNGERCGIGLVVAAVGASLIASLMSCDLSPRAPEQPGGGSEGRLVTLSDPDSALLQIQIGVADGVITAYMNAFTPDFVFHPDERDSITLAATNPGVFDDWTYDVERDVMQLVLSLSSQRGTVFASQDSIVEDIGVVTLRENYDLTIGSSTYQGLAELQMRDEAGSWRIFTWIDRRQSGSQLSSWSLVKGENR